MHKFIKELRRREVFRTAGLYVGIGWIAIEASSVILPTFDVPAWVFKAIVVTVFAGFPIALLLAWFYDVNAHGIERESDQDEPAKPILNSRLRDFFVIGLLSVALVFSLYMNMTSQPTVETPLEPVSVLIADFDNQTGDPLFDGSLEQVLNIGLEGAPFITAFKRTDALKALEALKPEGKLDEAGARLVSIREGVKLVVAGTIKPDGSGYEMSARVVNPEDGAIVADSSVDAKSKLEVLTAASGLTDSIREELGDKSVDETSRSPGETFTASSLEAVKDYTQAQNLAAQTKYEESLAFYESAVNEDPNFGRAYSGWALSLFILGREEEAEVLWEQALSKMDTMTDRERYRTLGLYYLAITGNYQKGIESYKALVDKYPADSAGYNNLAVAYFSVLDFPAALEAGRKALTVYPSNAIMLSNYALYAMYAGDFATGATQARELLKKDSSAFMAWLPIAVERLAESDLPGAIQAYTDMAKVSARSSSLANLGLADAAIYSGEFADAKTLLESGIESDQPANNKRLISTKYMMLADALRELGDTEAAREAIQTGLSIAGGIGREVPAALLWIELGDHDAAQELQAGLAKQLQADPRAYAALIQGVIATREGRYVEAIDALRAGINLANHWLLHYYMGRAYFEAGSFAEALDEFELCLKRRGEASSLFLDDQPTWRYMAPVYYWRGRAQEQLGMRGAANESLETFVSLRPNGGALAEDAQSRLPGASPDFRIPCKTTGSALRECD